MSPTARTLQLLRAAGYHADVVERWIPRANVRRDLGGFGDILAWHPVRGEIVAVQATSASNLSARLHKVRKLPSLLAWLRAGGLFVVHGWRKLGEKWEPRIVFVTAESLAGELMLPRRRGRVGRQMELFQ